MNEARTIEEGGTEGKKRRAKVKKRGGGGGRDAGEGVEGRGTGWGVKRGVGVEDGESEGKKERRVYKEWRGGWKVGRGGEEKRGLIRRTRKLVHYGVFGGAIEADARIELTPAITSPIDPRQPCISLIVA